MPIIIDARQGDRTYRTTLWVTLPTEAEADENGNHKRRQRTVEVRNVTTKKVARDTAKAALLAEGFIKPRTVKGSSHRVNA